MEKRKLGRSGLEVGPLALGGNVFGWTADQETCFRILDAFLAAGLNLVDTAEMYGEGLAEELVGEALGKRRDEFLPGNAA